MRFLSTSSSQRPSSCKCKTLTTSILLFLVFNAQLSTFASTTSPLHLRYDLLESSSQPSQQQQQQQQQHHHTPNNDLMKRQDPAGTGPHPPSRAVTSASPSSPTPSPVAAPTSLTSPSVSADQPDQQPIGLLLPQNQPNASLRSFPYTPATGANSSLYITPNVTNQAGLVEIRVGVLLPYSLPNNLTQQLAFSGTSAIRLAVSEINANQLIPGAFVTLVLKDSFNGLDPENSGAAQAIFSTVSLLQTNGGVSGVIGDVSSALSVQSALLTSRLSIPQCSFSAGSTQLSSKDDYSYFFRTIPTELMFGQVMVNFVASRGWKTIAVFYTGDSLGSQMMDNIAFWAAKKNIQIGYRRAFWEMGASSDVGPALDALEDSGQRIVLIAAVGVPQIRLMIEAVNKGLVSKDYVWLAINQITEPLLGANSTLNPQQLNGLFMFDNLLKLHGYTPYEQFLDKWAALDPTSYPYAGQRDISSNEAQAYSCMMVMGQGFANAVQGNWTGLHLLAAGKLGPKLKPLNMNTNYTGPAGPMVFDENGDVVYGNFILYNFQNSKVITIGTSYSGVFNLSSPPMYYDGTFNAPVDSAPLEILNPKFGSSIGMVIISVAGLSVLFSLLTMLMVVVYRDTQVIKASSPLFCCLELLGFIFLYISVVMGLDIPTNNICMVRPFTLNVGFVLVVSNIVAKNFRVYRIFHNIYVTKRVIRDSHLLKIVGTLLLVNLVIMVVWFTKTPPMLQQITAPDFTTYWTCNNQSGPSTPFFVILFVYNAALLLVAVFLAYKNRNVAANYNECRQIAFVVYNILLCGCLAMPTVFLPQDQFLTKFFLSTVVILFGTTFSLMFLFLPKLWELFTQIERSQQRAAAAAEMDLGGAHLGLGGNSSGVGIDGDPNHDSSLDGFLYSNATAGWMNSAGNLAVLGPGVTSAALSGGSANASSIHLPGGRKGSVGTLDDSKGGIDNTLTESHMGYMGIKFQNRYFSFLSSWCMRRVILYPGGRYFTCFEVGKPDTGRTFSYVSVFIHAREPGAYIMRVIGTGRYDFLLQVRDEERLLYWFSLFESSTGGGGSHGGKQQAHQLYSSGSSSGLGSILPMRNLSMASLSDQHHYHQQQREQYPFDGVSSEDAATAMGSLPGDTSAGGVPHNNRRSESDQTLFFEMDQNQTHSQDQQQQFTRGNNDFLSPMQYYQQNQQQQGSIRQRDLDELELTERGGHGRHPSESIDLSQALSSLHPSTNPFVRRQQQQQQR
ncbi:hypothetical protein BGZ83_003197 [Gryganskiella cystojenkinii]|nr:hypothetical protein BGZ83_003197 [Gryganskiella cystojenkinii]